MPVLRLFAFSVLVGFFLPDAILAEQPVDYTRQVRPILKRHCAECHNEKKARGGLRLDGVKHVRAGGDSGKVLVPGKAAKSLLIERITEKDDKLRMPLNRTPLARKEIDVLAKWIEQGATMPANDQGEVHWAFVAPKRPALPAVKRKAWLRNPIDYFVLARLEKEGIAPSPEADRVTLMRRLYLDVLGLPPTLAEVEAFLQDRRPDAYEKLVDRVLASPHYGERWGRHWLDVARYADTHGYTIDAPREIWKYRDWVVNALNRDMPFDQFVIEQMAGDMLPKATMAQKIATGFHRNTLINQEGGIDREQFRVEAVADRVATTGVVFLGLTLGCARCHDHKYDPIKQKEYYQLFAFLNNQSEPTLSIATPELAAKRNALTEKLEKLEVDLNGPLQDFVKKLPEAEQEKIKDNISMILNLRPDQRTESQKRTLERYFSKKDTGLKKRFAEIAAVKKRMPKFPTTMILAELGRPRETHVHIKGDFTRKGDRVYPGVPAVLHDLMANGKRKGDVKRKQYDRLDLARWLVDAKNPLVGRVTVNRIWQRYFGKGIVATENDFGTQGTPPTHPQLLDWLAVEFALSGWKMKHIHKLILTSATYRQSSKARPELAKTDPNNRLLARQNRFRLDAEIVRDNALAVSGLLSHKMGGPPVHPPQPGGVYAFTQVKRRWNTDTGADRYRRGLYTFFQRSAPYPMLITFDAPDGTNSCTRRVRSNTPLQALTLLNDQAFMEIAHGLATRILKEAPKAGSQRLRYAFQLCLAREPKASEAKLLEQYLQRQMQEFRKSPGDARKLLAYCGASAKQADAALTEQAAWTATARVLLNLDEFITRE